MNAIIEQRGEGLVPLDRRGLPEHWTPQAQDTFGRWFRGCTPGRLPEEVVAWLDDSLRVAVPQVPLLIDRGDSHLMVRRVPVRDGQVLLVSEVHNDRTKILLQRLGLSWSGVSCQSDWRPWGDRRRSRAWRSPPLRLIVPTFDGDNESKVRSQ
jgi:hypothetical protein